MSSNSDWIRIPVAKATQPIGTFYVGVARSDDLFRVCSADVRHVVTDKTTPQSAGGLFSYMGIQRPLSSTRVEEIKKYVRTVDASFPSSIIISVYPENFEFENESLIRIRNVPDAATIIDGQHRLKGFEGYDRLFDLPVTIFLDMEMEEQARLFSIINTKQTRINPSLARDLEAFSTVETPEKIAHNIARASNDERSNPWYGKLKMLGVRDDFTQGILTQHAFVTEIIGLTYPAKKFQNDVHSILRDNHNKRRSLEEKVPVDRVRYPFWPFYLEGKDDVTKKVLDNYFDSVKTTFPDDWGNPNRILTKTIGYIALMKHLGRLIPQGVAERSLSREFFTKDMLMAKSRLGPTELTVEEFGSSATGAEKLRMTLFADD